MINGFDPAPDPMWRLETLHRSKNLWRVAGVDEAGRGAWAGPVVVAAVILPFDATPRPYRDSKTLSARTRERLAVAIRAEAVAFALEFAPSSEVDAFGVLNATKRAVLRAVQQLAPEALITDYLQLPGPWALLAPAKADSSSYSVAAASILAKTARDAAMQDLDTQHPGYGFAKHKGYGVAAHREALWRLGPCVAHRVSFAPVAQAGLFADSKSDSKRVARDDE